MHSLARQPDLWNQHRFRTTFKNTPHTEVDDILLRFASPEACEQGADTVIDTFSTWYPAAKALPEVEPLVLDLMRYCRAYALERLVITRLKPGGQILPHADTEGDYVHAQDIERLHVVLQGLPGSNFVCGDETVNMQTGECWWFNAHQVHTCLNNSADDRIHLLVDLRYWR